MRLTQAVPLALFILFATSAEAAKNRRASIQSLDALYDAVAPAVVTIFANSPGSPSVGSGVLLHEAGFIATAGHVVEHAWEIAVEFKGGQSEIAEIVTLSRSKDLALLKVDEVPASTFVPELADSSKLVVGEPVFCIGAPLGLKHTVTTGIVSAIRSEFGSELAFLPEDVIQTDAAINQGNSGGALFNRDGEVIGIASFIASGSGGSIGLGFAVPSNTVRERLFAEAIPYIGVGLRRIPPALAEVLNWSVTEALLVEIVKPGSSAADAGLKGGEIEATIGGITLMLGGDLIVKVGDLEVGKTAEVHDYLTGLKAGDVIPYTVLRGGERILVEVTLESITVPPDLKPARTRRSSR
ncbi:MAG: trypsin-like peptidase domain-containing protein [Myxococcota bacterium]